MPAPMLAVPSLFAKKITGDSDDERDQWGRKRRARTTVVCSVCGEEGKKMISDDERDRWKRKRRRAPYLACCRKDVDFCQNDAKASSPEALEYFNNQAEDPDQFKEFIMRYKMQCPSLGQGRPRDPFDWAQELQTHSKESSEGFESEMMDFDQFMAWGKVKRNATHKQALARWLEIESNTPVEKRDIEGFDANQEPGRARLPIVTKVHGFSGSRPFLGQVGN